MPIYTRNQLEQDILNQEVEYIATSVTDIRPKEIEFSYKVVNNPFTKDIRLLKNKDYFILLKDEPNFKYTYGGIVYTEALNKIRGYFNSLGK